VPRTRAFGPSSLGKQTSTANVRTGPAGSIFLSRRVARRRAAEARDAAKWDKRVADLADFVERARGLDFEHAVSVRFLTEREFKKEITTDHGELTEEDKRDLEEAAGLLRAVGLTQLEAKQLFEDFSAVDAADTLAFYDQEEEEVVIRGKRLDIATKVTVVHELTHALQDHHFDLDKLDAFAGGNPAVLALVEGDAIRLEEEYQATLSHRAQEAYGAELDTQAAEAEGAVPPDVPAALEIMDFAPYSLGPTFVEAIVVDDGEQGVNDAFREPPTSDKQILIPSAYLDGDKPERVKAPKLQAGEMRVGKPDTFGALSLYLTLAARVDPAVALSTVASWDGDSFVQFERGDAACMRAAFAGTKVESTDQIAAVLNQWAALGPSGAATVARANNTATLTACDPGNAPDDVRISSAGDVLDARAFFLLDELGGGLPVPAAECVAERLAVDREVIAFYVNPEPSDAEFDAVDRKVADAEGACPI
jgi:hypothetical protein